MEKELYSMIFKRKSFHIFRDIGNKNPDETTKHRRKIQQSYAVDKQHTDRYPYCTCRSNHLQAWARILLSYYIARKRIIICKISVISVNSLTYILLLLELVHCGSVSVNLMSQPITVLILS